METTEITLKQKVDVLKRNIDNIGKEALKTRYQSAYNKLLLEIAELSKELIYERVLRWDLACVEEDALPKFTELFKERYKCISAHLLNGDFSSYRKELEDFALVYAQLWCDTVIKAKADYRIINPVSLERMEESKTA